jgi:hypothetical protein
VTLAGRPATRTARGRRIFTILPGTHPGPPVLDGETGDSGQGGSPPPIGLPSVPVDTYQLYDGTDELGIVGTVAPGLFAQGGRCWAHGRRKPSRPRWARHGASGVGRPAEVSNGWTKVWSCERHADELVSARRVIGKPFAG